MVQTKNYKHKYKTYSLIHLDGGMVTGLAVSGTWKKSKLVFGGYAKIKVNADLKNSKKEEKRNNESVRKYSGVNVGSLLATFVLVCLLACAVEPCCLVDTNALLYVLYCSVQGRSQAVLQCLRYVYTAVCCGYWSFFLCLRFVRRERRSRLKH